MLRSLLVVALLCLWCESVQAQLQLRWDSATTAEGQASQQLIQSDPRLAKTASFANSSYRFPRPLPLVYQETGKVNAWYHGGQHQITVSYGLYPLNHEKPSVSSTYHTSGDFCKTCSVDCSAGSFEFTITV